MKLKELPKEEMPRERLLKYGASNLSNNDLISILIRTGSKESNVKELSNKILSKIKNINSLNDLTINELVNIKGVGSTKAITILAAIELGKRVSNITYEDKVLLSNTDLVNKYFSPIIASEKQENLLVILLDNKNRLISFKNMFKGTNTSSLVSIKEIFNYAIKERADKIILMHNHPSGIITPSKEDIILTNSISSSSKIIGIPLIDHLITNGKEYHSFYKELSSNEE